MKIIFVCVFALASFSSFARGFDCVSTSTGLRYVVDYKTKTVKVLEKKKVISVEKFIKTSSLSLESLPPIDVHSFENQYGAFMEIREKAGKITGSFDDDEDLVCSVKR